jgi:hypothetical protein
MENIEPTTDVDVVVHWGCQLLRPDGSVYITRWNPTYGGMHFESYTEAEARADVANREGRFGHEGQFTKRLVTRTETTTVVTTPWVTVDV